MYENYMNNNYMTPQMYNQQQRLNMLERQYPQFAQQPTTQFIPQGTQFTTHAGLQGKSVDSVDVVKAIDIPLDGSISYFPLTDGTAIVTKQLQVDGTSKIITYKPCTADDTANANKYITLNEVNELLKTKDDTSDLKSIKDDIKTLKRQVRDLSDDIKDTKRKDD